jgi:tRNA pseudouridine55 synthase
MTQPGKRKRVPVHGVLLLDKPVGMSSTQALAKAKWLLNAQKAGHTGTLDPFATGLLPLCFGEATKFAQDLLDADKTYETVVHLGIKTSTGDTEGEVLERRPVDVTLTLTQIESILEKFRGPISQVPPMHSALKRDGKPLYEYARAGITLEREARSVTIHKLELLAYDAPMLRLRVACSKGTYIRVLGEDIGAALGCGAHLSMLRRIEIGALDISGALTLDQLAEHPDAERNSCLQPVDSLLSSFPALVLDDSLANRFRQGQRISLDRAGVAAPCESGRVRVYQVPHRLLGTALLSEGDVLAPERLLADIASH